MYLAGILALCALLHVPASGGVRSEFLSSGSPFTPFLRQDPAQQPASSDPTAGSQSSQPKPVAAPANQQDQPPQPPAASSEPATPAAQKVAPAPPKPETAPPKKKSVKKKKTHAPTTPTGEPQKRVVHRGSTVEPTTQLAPGMTGEQAARQRENTNQLLATTDASLQKVSSRQLSKDEQETVSQIRRFTQQAKEANAAGDLQRAYKLAVKARLLSDALAKP